MWIEITSIMPTVNTNDVCVYIHVHNAKDKHKLYILKNINKNRIHYKLRY